MMRGPQYNEKPAEFGGFFTFGLVAGARNQRYLQLWSGAA